MELEDLRDIWKKEGAAFKPKGETELASMLTRSSSSIVTRLKRNVWFELVITFLGGLGLLGYAFTLPDGALKWTSISIVFLFCLYSLYYFKKLRLLHRFNHSDDHIKANLQKLVTGLKGYLDFYRRSYAILYPVYFLLGLVFTAIEHGTTSFVNKISKPEIFVTLGLSAITFFICSTWLTNWYLRKLYGNHLEKLQNLLQELEA